MGKLVAFQIHFDRQHAVYSAGDLISGYVQVDLTETKFLRGKYKIPWAIIFVILLSFLNLILDLRIIFQVKITEAYSC